MPESRVFNTDPRPRMIVRGFPTDHSLRKRLSALVPTSVHVSSLAQVNQAEWDVLVTDSRVDEYLRGSINPNARLDAHSNIFVIYQAKATQISPDVVEWLPDSRGAVMRETGHIRRELRRVADIPSRVGPLVADFEPILRARTAHEHFLYSEPTMPPSAVPQLSSPSTAGHVGPLHPRLQPFAETADGRLLAGRYKRSEHAETWILPSDVPDLAVWVAAALTEWHALDAERFPGIPDWSRQRGWATRTERDLMDALEALGAERESLLKDLDDRELDVSSRLASAQQAADDYERALLTRHDDPLVQAVLKALTELGFSVVDADKDLDRREKLEDLRVEDPDAPGWIALVEVKGYTKGAQTGALTQFLRFDRRYRDRAGVDPSALWYVVNQFRDRDPGTRQTVLQSNEDDIKTFADVNGLVIDTVEIFQLIDDARSGRISPADARATLRNSTGRYHARRTEPVAPGSDGEQS